jgi:flagellar biosynthesis chaperone FliJ
MTTPFDAALRIAERELDEVRTAIGVVVEELDRIAMMQEAADTALTRESTIAGGDPRLTSDRFFARAREIREELKQQRAARQLQLDELRAKAVEHYGQHTAVSDAVARFRSDAELEIARAEQAANDDIAASRMPRRARRLASA